jgi:mannose-1-phosphate guanylyltransferase / mannose-6-phosphate isomerase
MYSVILSGGVGSRLWPVSRKFHPKPFIKMPNKLSILQNTFIRALELGSQGIINVTGNELLFKVQKDWEEISSIINPSIELSYILEPFGRSTTAAIVMTCLWVAETYGEDTVLLVLPSDHIIADQSSFNKAVEQAVYLAEQDNRIVTFGIEPTGPEIGYGYMEYENNTVVRFLEKPTLEDAKRYCASGQYLWNAGMFCFKTRVMLQEMLIHCPDILAEAQKCFAVSRKVSIEQLVIEAESFKNIREISLDYAIMEKSDKLSVIPCNLGWSDVGTWTALSKALESDSNGNILNAEVIADRVSNCYIEGCDRLIVIVDTPDALLIASKDAAQDVKAIYSRLALSGHEAHELHKTVHRPWGSYTILEETLGAKIKRIEVYPGASLSLQSHQHRSEHWIVVSGTAKVVNGEKELSLNINQSTYIPAGNKHRLSNLSDVDNLIIIEVQTGTYLGEDDIQRFEDIYGRVMSYE